MSAGVLTPEAVFGPFMTGHFLRKSNRFLFHTYLSSSEARDADVIEPERLAYRAATPKQGTLTDLPVANTINALKVKRKL